MVYYQGFIRGAGEGGGGEVAGIPPPPHNFEVDVFLILSSLFVAIFEASEATRRNFRASKLQKFPGGAYHHAPPSFHAYVYLTVIEQF